MSAAEKVFYGFIIIGMLFCIGMAATISLILYHGKQWRKIDIKKLIGKVTNSRVLEHLCNDINGGIYLAHRDGKLILIRARGIKKFQMTKKPHFLYGVEVINEKIINY